MRKQVMEVELDGREDTLRVSVDGRDIRRWEAERDSSFITDKTTYTMLTELAGFAAIRSGQWSGTLEEFLAVAVNVVQVSDEPANPTKKAPGGGRSRR